MKKAVPRYVYDAFYPQGWWERQRHDIDAVLDQDATQVLVAVGPGGALHGWVGVRIHPEDSMGELHILAVDPDHQRTGVASALIDAAHDRMRAAGMSIAMVETGDDPGHQPSRTTYESAGYERWPVARYFREL
ncbi:MAG: GNAT family N-acetyltransferase [Acidimicrobiia bacterium]|nr:GNAT family N-acetyltransferase [Acidimicrobiia bacterium]